MLVLDQPAFPSGDPVPSGPAPLSFVIKCPYTREFFCLFSFGLTLPRRALVIFFVYAVGPLVWTVHSDMPLLSAIAAISGFVLAFVFAFAFVSSASFCPCHRTNQVCCPWTPFLPPFLPPSSLPSLVHSSAPYPRCHAPDPVLFLRAPLPALNPFQAIAHTSSYDVSLLVSESLYVILASCVPTYPRFHWYWSVVDHHFVDDDLQFLHDFVELSRSRQELPFDVLRHHLPHNRCLLSSFALSRCSYSATFNDLALNSCNYGLQRYCWVIR